VDKMRFQGYGRALQITNTLAESCFCRAMAMAFSASASATRESCEAIRSCNVSHAC
jgi:hypothetical protein